MAESTALLVNGAFPEQRMRQWVLSFPCQLRFLLASRPQLMARVLGIVYPAISARLIQKAGFARKNAQTGVVTLNQRFGSALNLDVHFHGVDRLLMALAGSAQTRDVITFDSDRA